LFTGIADRYRPRYREDGSLAAAIAERDAGRAAIVHVHWEEFALRDCASESQAGDAAAAFANQIDALRARRTPIVWTVHNELPHEIRFHRAFLRMRAVLADAADAILVHNATSIAVLARQVSLDRGKVVVLEHPSYLDRLEDERDLRAGLTMPHERWIQGFGWIRAQKGFGGLIDALPRAFLRERGLAIRISGAGDEASAVIAQQAARTDVVWDVRRVPDADVPALLRSAMCVVLPYERVLTSGVALLAMSVGAMLVAVDIPQFRELLPERSRRFLYACGDAAGLRRAIDAVCMLAPDERRAIVDANLRIAGALRPAAIARRLAAIYDAVRGTGCASGQSRLCDFGAGSVVEEMMSRNAAAPRPVTPLGIIAANLETLAQQARTLGYADPQFAALLAETSRLAGGFDAYLEEMSSPASPLLVELAAETARRDWTRLHESGTTGLALEQEMLSGHLEGRFLNLLVRATRAKRILEIGVFTGYSALAMAEALPEDGRLVACEIDAYAANVARTWFDRSEHGRKIRVRVGPGRTTLEQLLAAGESFDFVFIDADKASYGAYVDALFGSALLEPDGLVCVDNTLMQGEPYLGARTHNGEAIAAFNRQVAADPRLEHVLLPIRDGLTLIRRAGS
jgi:caffeoyl-CoA O-methyltransferase